MEGCLGCFHIFAIVKNAEMIIRVQVSLQDNDFVSYRYTPRNEILDHKVIIFFYLLGGNTILFSIMTDEYIKTM